MPNVIAFPLKIKIENERIPLNEAKYGSTRSQIDAQISEYFLLREKIRDSIKLDIQTNCEVIQSCSKQEYSLICKRYPRINSIALAELFRTESKIHGYSAYVRNLVSSHIHENMSEYYSAACDQMNSYTQKIDSLYSLKSKLTPVTTSDILVTGPIFL